MKKVFGLAFGFLALASLASCYDGEEGTIVNEVSYKDGTYYGESSKYTEYDGNTNASGYATVEITIENKVITDCDFNVYTLDGVLKDQAYVDETYKDLDEELKNYGQAAYESIESYEQLVILNNGNVIDCRIASATFNFTLLQEALSYALEDAKE